MFCRISQHFHIFFGETFCADKLTRAENIQLDKIYYYYKKLSYCWETVRRESMPRIAEMDVEMTI